MSPVSPDLLKKTVRIGLKNKLRVGTSNIVGCLGVVQLGGLVPGYP